VDKANRVAYDFSSILYLSEHGTDFTGGRLFFLDRVHGESQDLVETKTPTSSKVESQHPCDHKDRPDGGGTDSSTNDQYGNITAGSSTDRSTVVRRSVVVPSKGRFVAFTSGLENVHHVSSVKVIPVALALLHPGGRLA
jgi:hypothetical protein